MREPTWVDFGYIARPHGVRGELRVTPFGENTEFPEGVDTVRLFKSAELNSVFRIESLRLLNGALGMVMGNLQTREDAMRWKGSVLQIPEESLPLLDEGEYYLYELVGASVRQEDGTKVGTVQRLLDNGGQYLLEIEHGGKTIALPYVPAFVLSFDRSEHQIEVRIPAGLWDI